jgi:hypothetical protein
MITTYTLERSVKEGSILIEYFERLCDAKTLLLRHKNIKDLFILCINGPSFGEGWHQYKLTFDGKKWRRS